MIIFVNSCPFVFIFFKERFDGIFLSKIRFPFPWNSYLKTGFQGKRNSKRFHQKISSKDDNKWASIKFCKKKERKKLYFVRNPDPTAALWGPILPVS